MTLPPSPPVFAPVPSASSSTLSAMAPSSRSLSSSAPTNIDFISEYHRKRRAEDAAKTAEHNTNAQTHDTADDADAADVLAQSKSPTIFSILLQSHNAAASHTNTSTSVAPTLPPNLEGSDEGDDDSDGDGERDDDLQFNISLDETDEPDDDGRGDTGGGGGGGGGGDDFDAGGIR